MRFRVCTITIVLFVLMSVNAENIHARTTYAADNQWTVTQQKSGRDSAMCYTIEDAKGRLAIIDGGWESDAKAVEEIIKSHNNTVDAWIITHPHPDHVGAINKILEDRPKNGVQIKQIYTVKVDDVHYRKTAKPTECYEAYTKFRKLTSSGNVNIIYVKENRKYKILGLKMNVLSAWPRAYLKKVNHSVCNLGSMVFKLSGKKKSMLFCGDCKAKMQKRLLRRQGKNLRATYVQCAHHGCNGFTNSFYRHVKPQKAFFDASIIVLQKMNCVLPPRSLMSYLSKHDVKIITWDTAPNKVMLK